MRIPIEITFQIHMLTNLASFYTFIIQASILMHTFPLVSPKCKITVLSKFQANRRSTTSRWATHCVTWISMITKCFWDYQSLIAMKENWRKHADWNCLAKHGVCQWLLPYGSRFKKSSSNKQKMNNHDKAFDTSQSFNLEMLIWEKCSTQGKNTIITEGFAL